MVRHSRDAVCGSGTTMVNLNERTMMVNLDEQQHMRMKFRGA